MPLRRLALFILAASVAASASVHTAHYGLEQSPSHLDPATGIVLEGGPGETISFAGEGAGSGALGVSLGTCGALSCTLTGTFSGSGGLLSTGTFAVNSAPNSILLTPTATSGLYQASGAAQITLTGTAGGSSGTLLTGNLNLVNFFQPSLPAGLASIIGSFNAPALGSPVPDIQVTGGLLADAFTAAGGILQLNVQLPAPLNVGNLIATRASISTQPISTSLTPTPEPASLALFGLGGLALIGLGIRRRAWPVVGGTLS